MRKIQNALKKNFCDDSALHHPFSTIFILLFLSNSEKLVNVSSLFMLSLIMIVVGFLIMWMSLNQ